MLTQASRQGQANILQKTLQKELGSSDLLCGAGAYRNGLWNVMVTPFMRTAWRKRRIAGNHCLYVYIYIYNHMCFLCIHFRGFRVTCPWSQFQANEQPTCQGVQQQFAYVHTSASKKQGLKCLAVVSCFGNRHFNPQRVANRVGILTVWSHCMKGESFAVVHGLFKFIQLFWILKILCIDSSVLCDILR